MNYNILTAARDTPSVKRVVITSSLGAYIAMQDFATGKLKEVYRGNGYHSANGPEHRLIET